MTPLQQNQLKELGLTLKKQSFKLALKSFLLLFFMTAVSTIVLEYTVGNAFWVYFLVGCFNGFALIKIMAPSYNKQHEFIKTEVNKIMTSSTPDP